MPKKVIKYNDATVTINVPIFGGDIKVDVYCRLYNVTGMSVDEFAALIYPSIDAQAKKYEPANS
jgi:hypothetical protein